MIFSDEIVYKSSGVTIFVDGSESSFEDIKSMPKDHLVSIGLICDPYRILALGIQTSAAITLRTKEGWQRGANDESLLKAYPLGYLVPDEFYMPKYENETDRIKDEEQPRRTLYWNPSLNITNGVAECTFTSSKGNTTYTILYDGVSEQNNIFIGSGKLCVKD